MREDYSPHGTAWDSLPHDHARSRAFPSSGAVNPAPTIMANALRVADHLRTRLA